jgi:DNA-binding SARP family transcriptional activator
MRFEALGPLTVTADGGPVRLRPAHRRLLACLLLNPGSWVTTETLADRMWGESPPDTARSTLHVHLSAVRRHLPGVVNTGDRSYLLDLTDHDYDIPEFSSLVADAVTRLEQGHFKEATELALRATGMWRGLPFHELDDVDAARADRARLIELSTAASAALARALMLQGRVSESIAHLRAVVQDQPFNEGMWEELIRAYYLTGRQVDALKAFNEAKRILGDEMGLEPGPRLRDLEERVLRQDLDMASSCQHRCPIHESTSKAMAKSAAIDRI